MKILEPDVSGVLQEEALREKTILNLCHKITQIPKLVEHFEEHDLTYVVNDHVKCDSLSKTLVKLGKNFLRESEVRKVLY